MPFPLYGTKWIDIRKLFGSFYQTHTGNLAHMLNMYGLEFKGREHSGLDDARNIARITSQLIADHCSLGYNRFIPPDLIDKISKNKPN